VAAIVFTPESISDAVRADLKSGLAVPAGRDATGNDPRWRCLHCRFEWGHPRGLSGSSTGSDDLA
jgi:hypothetical protein